MTYLAISVRVTLVVTSFCLLLHATLSEAAKKTLLTYIRKSTMLRLLLNTLLM